MRSLSVINVRNALSRMGRRGRSALFALIALGALTGCGGGSGGVSADTGQVIIGLTDAEDAFVTYTVDVVSLRLRRADGAVAETLPLEPRVDFAQYVDLTEFLTAATVPNGVYVEAELTLDFTDSDIRVATEDRVVSLEPRDTAGNPIGITEVTVRLADGRPLRVRPGLPAHLTLDFDLQASNQVDIDAGVTIVSPFVFADVEPEAPKIHRVRGPLAGVDLRLGSLQVGIRPFHLRRGDFGRLEVLTDQETVFEIDGIGYTGPSGLAVLDGKPLGTAIVATGDLKLRERDFVAKEIYAGSSVAGGTSDVVTGIVVARLGDVLSVRGATLVRADGRFVFSDSVRVVLGSDTRVVRQLAPTDDLDPQDISVGQRIQAFGTVDDSLESPTLDAGSGLVRMLVSRVSGVVSQLDTGRLVMAVQTINRRAVGIYDFSGTGTDPSQYRVSTGAIMLPRTEVDSPVATRGFPVGFGAAASEDFEALTVVGLQSAPAVLAVDWDPASQDAFRMLEPDAIRLSLDGVGLVHDVFRGGVSTDLLDYLVPPSLVSDASGHGLYALSDGGTVQLYTAFESFVEGVGAKLAQARLTDGLLARGRWDDPTAELETRLVAVRFAGP